MRIQTIVERHDLTPRNHGQVMNQINRRTGERHQGNRVKKHFSRNNWSSPGGPYGIAPRSAQTIRRKRRLGIDPYRPNYQTGAMLAAIESSSTVRATQNKWTWQARNPRFPMTPWRRREIESIAKDEIAADTAFMGKEYARMAQQPRYQRKRRRKVG